jgi:hypothetical protein
LLEPELCTLRGGRSARRGPLDQRRKTRVVPQAAVTLEKRAPDLAIVRLLLEKRRVQIRSAGEIVERPCRQSGNLEQ